MAAAAPDDEPLVLAGGTVGEHLRAEDTRAATLQALEALPQPIPRELALAAAPALVDAAAGTADRGVLDRCTLLVVRLVAEAAPDPSAVYGAAFGGERLAAHWAPRVLVEAMQRALGSGEGARQQPLTREDASSFACLEAYGPPAWVRGITAPEAAAGRTVMEHLRIVRVLPVRAPPHLLYQLLAEPYGAAYVLP